MTLVAGIEDGRREAAVALRESGDGRDPDDAGLLARALPVGEEEGAIAAEGSAEDEAVLVAAEAGFGVGGIGEEVARVQAFVAEEFKERAVELVGAGFLIDEDDAAVGASVFGGVGVGFDAKLLDGVNDGEVGDLSGFGLKDADAVVEVFADAGARSIDAGEGGSGREVDAGREGDQGNEVASVDGEIDDALLIELERHSAAGLGERGDVGGDVKGLGDVAQGEGEIEGEAIRGAEGESGAGEGREAGMGDGEGVGSGGEGDEVEAAIGGGGLGEGDIEGGMGEADGGVGEGGSGRIAEEAVEFLGEGGTAEEE